MALEDIFRALDEQADAECEQILREARDHGDVILADAEEQAEAIRTARVADAERVTRTRASKSVNAAKLDARKRVAAVKEQAVDAAFARASELLKSVRNSERYAAAFQALAKEALEGVEGDAEVMVDPADEALASQTLAELGVQARLKTDMSSTGGLVVVLPGGRIVRRNTLEDRLDKVSEQAQAAVAEIIFS
jgi:V/A-type H+-transporting ATPase subunit E